ncbi:MAG: flavodoxin family protein [Candidatus Rifleibacteriota bacterium]
MKVVAFNGSPKKDGNTAILLKTALEELKTQGIETELVHIGGQPLRGCIACGKCVELKNQKCVLPNDSINEWIQKVIEADGIILGSPTYFADVSAEMKAFIDRVGMVGYGNGSIFRRKVGGAVVAVRRGGSIHVFDTMNHFFQINQMIVVGSSYWNMGYGMTPGEVNQDEEGIQTMRNLGRNMGWLISCIEAGKDKVPVPETLLGKRTNFIRQ